MIENMLMDSNETDNNQLFKIGKLLLGSRFLSVLPANHAMYGLKHKNTCCILNTDASDRPGLHWTGLIRLNNDITWFYDTYRRPYIVLSSHWEDKPWQQVINTEEQSITSEICGQMTLSMLCTVFKYGKQAFYMI